MTLTIIVAGRADSEDLAIAYSVLWAAKKKYGRLFDEKVIRIVPEKYEGWLQETLEANKWGDHKEEVICWIELGFKGGPKELIGGLDVFLEYMYENYKVLKPIKREKAELIAQKTVEQIRSDDFFGNLENAAPKRYFVITIVGAGHKATFPLVYELLRARFCIDQHGTLINLYDRDPAKFHEVEEICRDLNSMEGLLNARSTIRVFNDIRQASENVCLLIFLGDDSNYDQSLGKKLRRNYHYYREIAVTLDPILTWDVRVVFTCMDYRCFNASVFTSFTQNINKHYVVAITSHLALETASYMSKASGLPLSHFQYESSIVWGCVGLSHCVDISNGDVLYNLMRFKNDLPPEDFETMDFNEFNHDHWGEDDWILRKQDYIVQSLKNMWYYENLYDFMNTPTYISQVKATMDFLNRWYAPNPKSETLSAGVFSDGSYGFPAGLFMSQPIYIEKSSQELNVKPDVIKSKDLLDLRDLALFPLGIIRKLIHGRVFDELIVDQEIITLIEIGDEMVKQKLERERLEREKLEKSIGEEEENGEEEEFLVEVEAEENVIEEAMGEEALDEGFEEIEVEGSQYEQPPTQIESVIEEEEEAELDYRPFLDATYIPEKDEMYSIGIGTKDEPLDMSELTEEQKATLESIREYRNKPVQDAYILRKKEVYPPDGIREFVRRPDYIEDPAFAAVRPIKFLDVPVLTIQWPEIKRVIERLQQLKKKSREEIVQFYADKVMFTFKAKERKAQRKRLETTISIDPVLSDDDIESDNDVTPRLKKLPQMDTSFLFKHDFNIDFSIHDSRPFQREFTEPVDEYEKRTFISTIQSVEDLGQTIYQKHVKSLNV